MQDNFEVSASRQSRNLGRDRDFLILSRHQCPDQKVLIEIEKFVKIWKFLCVSTVCLNLDWEVHGFLHFLVKISQSVKTFYHFQTQKVFTMSRFLDKSQLSRRVSSILTEILTSQSLDWKVSILKILTEKKKVWSWLSRKSRHLKKVDLDTKDLDWSWLSRPPGLLWSNLGIMLRMRDSYTNPYKSKRIK